MVFFLLATTSSPFVHSVFFYKYGFDSLFVMQILHSIASQTDLNNNTERLSQLEMYIVLFFSGEQQRQNLLISWDSLHQDSLIRENLKIKKLKVNNSYLVELFQNQ